MTHWFPATLGLAANVTAVAALLLDDGRTIVWTGSLGAVLLGAFIVLRRWRRDPKSVPLLGMVIGVVGAVVAAGIVAFDEGESRAAADTSERIVELEVENGQLRSERDGLASELDDLQERASEQERDASERSTSTTDPDAAGGSPDATEPPLPDTAYLVDLEPSRIVGDLEGFERCGSEDKISGRSYQGQACWNIAEEFVTEWTLTDDFTHLRGIAGILDSCPQDTTYGLKILGDRDLLHSTTMVVEDVEELDVPIRADILRVTIEIDGGNDNWGTCASIGELRLE